MNEQQVSTLTQRLEHLEQEVRQCRRESHWWRVVGSGAVVVLVAVVLVGATGSKVAEDIRARQFTLVDESGMILFKLSKLTIDTLTGQPKNETRMSFFDKEGEERLAVSIFQLTTSFPQNPGVILHSSKPPTKIIGGILTPAPSVPENFISLIIGSDGLPALIFSHFRVRMRLKLAQDGSPDLVFYDQDDRESHITAELPSQGRAWVLWRQPPVSTVSGVTFTPIALGAWPTQSQCEAEALKFRQQPPGQAPAGTGFPGVKVPQPPPESGGQTPTMTYTCLPDTVNLRSQR